MLKIAVLGAGNMGKNHLRNLTMLRDVEVSGVYDIDTAVMQNAAAKFNVPYSNDINEILSKADAAIIVTPASTHLMYFEIVSKHVKYVFLEKPASGNLDQANQIKQIALSNNMKVQVGFIERFNPAIIGLKKIINGTPPINTDFIRTDRLSARITDTSVIFDLMIHDIDLALYLYGPVKSLSTFGEKEEGKMAFVHATLIHESGCCSRVLASRVTQKRLRKISVTSMESFICLDLLRREVIINKQSRTLIPVSDPYIITSERQKVDIQQEEPLLLELRTFIDLCKHKESVSPSLDDATNALAICHEIERLTYEQNT